MLFIKYFHTDSVSTQIITHLLPKDPDRPLCLVSFFPQLLQAHSLWADRWTSVTCHQSLEPHECHHSFLTAQSLLVVNCSMFSLPITSQRHQDTHMTHHTLKRCIDEEGDIEISSLHTPPWLIYGSDINCMTSWRDGKNVCSLQTEKGLTEKRKGYRQLTVKSSKSSTPVNY